MNEEKKLVPKLRFPKFRGAEGWTASVLARACDMQAGKFVAASNISESNQTGLFPCYGGNGLRGYTTTHTHDGTYPLIGRQGALCGNVRLVSGKFHATEHAVVATPKNAIDVGWLYYSLDLLNLNRFATGQAQPGLSVDVLENVSLAIPVLEDEQQKIADCLSSLDELIAAQARKVDALKTHKKGLMQQLFPREGETQPRLRFPEFKNSEEWRELPLAALAEKIMVGIASAATHAYRETGVPMVRNQNIKEGGIDDFNLLFIDPAYEVAHKNKRLRAGDVITVRTGYPGLSAVVTQRHHNAQCFTSLITRPKKDVLSPDYLCAYINSDIGKRFITGAEAGGAQKNVNVGALETLPVHLPALDEQKRIASFISSLDVLIAAAVQELDAIKTHKQGLMQQLFPSAEALDA